MTVGEGSSRCVGNLLLGRCLVCRLRGLGRGCWFNEVGKARGAGECGTAGRCKVAAASGGGLLVGTAAVGGGCGRHGGLEPVVGDRGVEARDATRMLHPPSLEAPELRVLSSGDHRLESSYEDRVPLIAITLRNEEFEDGVEVGTGFGEKRMGCGNVPPPPPPDRCVCLPGHHHRRVGGEIEDSAFVGHQLGGTGDGPIEFRVLLLLLLLSL